MALDVILVGIDGSETAECAAREAIVLASATGARVHLVTAMTKARDFGHLSTPGECWQLTSLDQAESLLAEAAQRLVPVGVDRSTAVLDGKPADAIVAEAERVHASLIVVGNKRMQGVKRVLGAVAADVARHAPCSVYIAKTT